jgi:hypothetical protein
VQRLAEAAERLVATIRPLDPKPHNVKKKLCKNLEVSRRFLAAARSSADLIEAGATSGLHLPSVSILIA